MTTNDPGRPEPEYLGPAGTPAGPGAGPDDQGPPSRGRGRRTGLVAGAAVAVVAAVGAGAYGMVQLMSGGSSAATAIPADALAYVSLDLDPSASQKIEAFKIMRKFPSIKKEIGGRDDIRRTVFEEFVEDTDCTGLDYEKDVEPWIGDRVALAAVPDEEEVALPLVALQVSDQEAARTGVRALVDCEGSEKVGTAFVGDYLLVAETQKQADAMAADADEASLEDAEGFTTAIGRTGDPGIVTMYLSQDAPAAMMDSEASSSGSDTRTDQLRTMFKDFEGAAGVVRFDDGAVEAEFAARGMPGTIGAVDGDGPDVATLPDTTAAALSVAFRDGWSQDFLDTLDEMVDDGESVEEMLTEAERATGLELPEDLEKLFGDGFSVSVDAGADPEELFGAADPSQVPAGIRITGDPAEITPVVDKLKAAAGPMADSLRVESGEGAVAIGLNPEYVGRLLEDGTLGDVDAFTDVVPESDRVASMLYVNFDAGDGWAEKLAELLSDGDPAARRNVAPLDAFGISAWQDDDRVQHGLVRLTTD